MSLYRSHPELYAWLKDATDDFSHDYPAMFLHWLATWLVRRLLPLAIVLAILAFLGQIFLDFLATY